MNEVSFRATASTLTMATYGYEVESEEDAYVKLVEEVNLMTVEPGAPGSTLPDLFPICEFTSYTLISVHCFLC